MSSIRSFASPQTAAPSSDERRATGQTLMLALALLVTVLIVEAVAIANAARSLSEIGWLYGSTT